MSNKNLYKTRLAMVAALQACLFILEIFFQWLHACLFCQSHDRGTWYVTKKIVVMWICCPMSVAIYQFSDTQTPVYGMLNSLGVHHICGHLWARYLPELVNAEIMKLLLSKIMKCMFISNVVVLLYTGAFIGIPLYPMICSSALWKWGLV